jgi:8-oxo-dGTP pyrophosphatase MutT (NUDIX family)
MREKPDYYYKQSAVVPYLMENGKLKIILVTSRKKKHWIIPKGIVEPDMRPADSALKEAYEEAGAEGVVEKGILTTFEYRKWGGVCQVKLFLMRVTALKNEWPEMPFRERKILEPDDALKLIDVKPMRKAVKKIIGAFNP